MSEYLVQIGNGTQEQDEHEVDWRDLGVFEAANQRAAIKVAMEKKGLEEGAFRATPNSSAKVHRVAVEKHAVWS